MPRFHLWLSGFVSATLTLFITLAVTTAQAAGPEYVDDPFGDADFRDTPMILDTAHPTSGRGELGLMFVSSIIDKYTSHSGVLIDFNYHFTDTIGAALSFGFAHGQLTNIVTDAEGIIGNKVGECQRDANKCGDINPKVPDYKQITGMVDLAVVWSPLYGKINLVSELNISMQIYGLAGVGINGTRTIQAETSNSPRDATDYTLRGDKFFDAGLFSDVEVHGTAGFGLRLIFTDWLDLRGEVRGVFFGDEFEFERGQGAEGYLSAYWFTNVGLGFILF